MLHTRLLNGIRMRPKSSQHSHENNELSRMIWKFFAPDRECYSLCIKPGSSSAAAIITKKFPLFCAFGEGKLLRSHAFHDIRRPSMKALDDIVTTVKRRKWRRKMLREFSMNKLSKSVCTHNIDCLSMVFPSNLSRTRLLSSDISFQHSRAFHHREKLIIASMFTLENCQNIMSNFLFSTSKLTLRRHFYPWAYQ